MGDEVSVSRDVAAPAEAVWDLISDVSRMGEWSPETTSARWIKGATGPTEGARFQGTNRHGSRRWKTVATVTAAARGERFAFRVTAGPLKIADWGYELTPTDDGCRVTETWTDLRSGLSKAVSGPISGVKDRATHNRATMEQTLERLGTAAEAAGATT